MKHCIRIFVLILSSAALLVSADHHQRMKESGRETRLNGRFKSSTGNWCAWTEVKSDKESTAISIACHCRGRTGNLQVYTCNYVSQGKKLQQCKNSRPKLDDVYDDIGSFLSSESVLFYL